MSEGSAFFSSGTPEIVVFPMFIDLQNAIRCGQLIVGAQCGRSQDEGAFTGDVSMKALKEFGCTAVLCGHSERRRYHHETDEEIAAQVTAAINVGLTAILCIGETADERDAKKTHDVLRRQLAFLGTTHCALLPSNFVVAYEPVWAIGSGQTPTPAQVQELHVFIRSLLPEQESRIIYGGSVDASNATGFLREEEIDGLLVGGASLDPDAFRTIVTAAGALA